jgi:polysaccharide export outer membrane protein
MAVGLSCDSKISFERDIGSASSLESVADRAFLVLCVIAIRIVPRDWILWTGLLASIGCASTHVFDYDREPDPRQQEFVVGVADVLRINVWHMPDLSVDAKVRPDGTVTMPLIGDLTAAGRTTSAVRSEIETRLKSYIRDDSAKVSVAVSEVNSYQFTVAGNAEHQGLFSSHHFVTVTEAAALAGGPSRFASLSNVVIIRPAPGSPRRIPIDLAAIYSGKHPEMNLVIVAGDTLYLP